MGLGAVFIYASLDKIAHPLDFARIVYRYRLAGPSATLGVVPANAFALILPWLEAVIGVLLVTGFWRREAAAITAALLVMFLVAVGYVMWQGIDDEHCRGFTVGGGGRSAGGTLIASDLGLLAAALYVLLVPPRTVASVSAAEPLPAA